MVDSEAWGAFPTGPVQVFSTVLVYGKGMSERVEDQRIDIDDRALRSRVFRLAWPVMAEAFLQTFVQIVSMVLVGHLGSAAVTSIGLSTQPLQVFYAIFQGAGVGATAVVARLIGQGDERQAGKASAQAVTLSVIIAAAGAAVLFANARAMVVWMGAAADVVPEATRYLTVLAPGLFCMWVQTVMAGGLRGAGDMRTPLKVSVIINIINLIGNMLLVYGLFGFPALGVYGAGLATTIARVVGALMMLVPYLSNRSVLYVSFPHDFFPDLTFIARILRVGIPGAVERVLFSGGMMFYSRMVAALGTVAYAAHTIGLSVESIAFMPGGGFGTAATTLVGQSLGARRPDVAERSTYMSFWMSCAFVGSVALLFLFIPEYLIGIYSKEPEVIRLGSIYLRIFAFCQFHQAAAAVFSGALRGAGDTKFVMYMTSVADTVVLLGSTYILLTPVGMGIVGAWIGMAIEGIFRGVACLLWFRTGRWKRVLV
jgi:putative MATE family efflux protein